MAKSVSIANKERRKVNLYKITLYAIIVNSCQIIAITLLAVYSLAMGDIHLTGWFSRSITITASLMVIWGAAIDIREAHTARKNARQRQALEEAYEQLEELNGTLRAQRHDFMNHIQVIYTLTELGDNQDALDYMDRVYADIQKVGRLLKTSSPAVNALLAAKLADCEENGVTFSADIRTLWDSCPIPGWEMCRILGNLIDNAMEAMNDASERRITVSLWEDVRSLHFSVENTGSPIPESIRRDIFIPGFSTKGNDRGTGLHIVSSILKSYGGSIEVSSTEASTCFCAAIPREQPRTE